MFIFAMWTSFVTVQTDDTIQTKEMYAHICNVDILTVQTDDTIQTKVMQAYVHICNGDILSYSTDRV